ncbi:hypothetical protein HNR46_004161 [Haloferula luteola]|uniref:Protein-arginine deiminase C-terminal domain-containing protein n=1 Tax=Haloferula luteola TaxID=595692 RepID=A0A840V9Y5_9BACT|nr:protein-arginine deiminase family protein [Haloferula luteola]MBB5353896.1 hypothetical protein [Haloferula luteola]
MEIDLRPGIDSDGDGIPNVWEWRYGLNFSDGEDAGGDADGDGISNFDEYLHRTNPTQGDTDGDRLPDGLEVSIGTSPTDADTDHDGIPDGEEDQDDDGSSNYWEHDGNSDPTDPQSLPELKVMMFVAEVDRTYRASDYSDPDWAYRSTHLLSTGVSALINGGAIEQEELEDWLGLSELNWPAYPPVPGVIDVTMGKQKLSRQQDFPEQPPAGWGAWDLPPLEAVMGSFHFHSREVTVPDGGNGEEMSYLKYWGTHATKKVWVLLNRRLTEDLEVPFLKISTKASTLDYQNEGTWYEGAINEATKVTLGDPEVVKLTVRAGENVSETGVVLNPLEANEGTFENERRYDVDLLPVDLAVDTDRSGTIELGADSADEDQWTKERGAIYAVNFDRDGDNASGGEKRPDAIYFEDNGSSSNEDWEIENAADEEDIAPMVIAAMESLPDDFKVFLKVEEAEDMRAIHLYKKIEAGENAIWGSHGDPSAAPWAGNDDNPTDNLIEITKWVNPNATDYEETRDGGTGDYTFGIEGLVLRGMEVDGGSLDGQTRNPMHSGKFSGEIQFSLEIRDENDNVEGSDLSPVRLRVAPWLMISRDEPSEEIWTADLGAENAPFRNEALNGRYAGLSHSGQLRTVASFERWFQDHLEIGFTQRPGGPKTHMVFRVPYNRGPGSAQPDWPVENLLKEDVGIFQIGIDGNGSGVHAASGNYGGNIEVLTPNTTNPLGLVMMGNNASGKMKAFIEAQEFQQDNAGSFSARSDWLIVGHIDEYTSFLSGGRIFISDARQAIELLQSEIPVADRAKRVFFATNGNTLTGTVTADTAETDGPATPLDETRLIYTGRNHVAQGDNYQWIRFYDGNAKGHVAKVKLHDGFLEVENIPGTTAKAIFYTGISMNEYEEQSKIAGVLMSNPFEWGALPQSGDDFVLVENTKFWQPAHIGSTFFAYDFNGDGVSEGMPAFITVKEVLGDVGLDNFVQFNYSDVAGVINDDGESPIRSAAGSASPHFIPVPSLFFGRDLPSGTDVESPNPTTGLGGSVAFNPGPTNLQPVNGCLYVPRQFGPVNAAGEDIFEKVIKNAVQESVYFVDCWDSYHTALGEIHCGSNVKRMLPSWKWWEKTNQ